MLKKKNYIFSNFQKISQKFILQKLIPIINCKYCGFTYSPKLCKPLIEKFEKCECCSKEIRSYSYEMREYYNIKLQLILFVIANIILLSVFFQLGSYLLIEFLHFFLVYLIIDQSMVRLTKFYLKFFIVISFVLYFWNISYFYFLKFMLVLLFCLTEITKVNKVIARSIFKSKF
jgi:hypothetical protein